MPFLIRIILQRTLAVTLSFLAFFGIDPVIPTIEDMNVIEIQRQELVENILSEKNNTSPETALPAQTEKKVIEETSQQKATSTKISTPETPKTQSSPTKNLPTQKIEQPANIPQPANTPQDSLDNLFETINENLVVEQNTFNIENVLVNIICTEKKGDYITVNTGSGVIVSPDGVVITNAHVAQYFLLEKKLSNYNCSLYQENIPTYGYVAELLYISPSWIKSNKDVIVTKDPKGTGEKDYALLYITKNTNPALSKPKTFHYAKINTGDDLDFDETVSVAGFPGSPANLVSLNKTVGLKKDSTKIKDVFTFANNKVDVVSTDVTPVAAKGASGGGLFKDKDLVALIVTTNDNKDGSYINAITTNYINRDLKKEFGKEIFDLINSDLQKESQRFWENHGETLAEIILTEL